MTAPKCATCAAEMVIVRVHHQHMPPTEHSLCTECITGRQQLAELAEVPTSPPKLSVVRSA